MPDTIVEFTHVRTQEGAVVQFAEADGTVPSARLHFGTTAGTVCAGDDSRLEGGGGGLESGDVDGGGPDSMYLPDEDIDCGGP